MVSVYAVPVDATIFCGLCRFVTPCWHLPNIRPWKRPKNAIPTAWNKLRIRSCFWLRWHSECTLEDSKKNHHRNYHLLVLSCHSSVHMAHWKSSNNVKPSLFFHSLCIRSSLHSIPCRPHLPFLGPLAFVAHSIHGGARGEELLHDSSVATVSRPVQRCVASGAEGLGDVNGWRAPPRGSPPPTPTLDWERLESVEWSPWVSSFSKLYSELAQWSQWKPLSLLVFVKITKTTNWWNLPQQKIRKIRKRENRFLTPKKTCLNISQAFSSALSHPYSRPIQVANVQELFFLKMFYDVVWCFTSMSYHRHAENVLSKVDIACGQFVLYHVISLQWWGAPKMPVDATVFCSFVTSCIVTCQISHHGVWEDSQNPNPT